VAYLGFQKEEVPRGWGVGRRIPSSQKGCSLAHWEGGLALPSPPKYATVNKCEIKTEITTDSHKPSVLPSVLVTGQA